MLKMMSNMLNFCGLLAGIIFIVCLTVGVVLVFLEWLKDWVNWVKENEESSNSD